jgi:G3E family GTPase
VIDSEALLQDFQAADSEVAEILAQQIEEADCVVIVPGGSAARALAESLNPEALLLEGFPGSLDPSQMLTGTPSGESPAAKTGAAHTFRSRMPFHPERFFEALQSHWQGTLRSKGRFWLASRPDQMGLWSQAGPSASIEAAGPWLAAIPQEQWEEHWDLDAESLAEVEANWDPRFGDREQELTLVGAPEGLLKVLESCLLTEEELALGRNYWQNSSDPFPAWT